MAVESSCSLEKSAAWGRMGLKEASFAPLGREK